jgi:hypothetical protein
MTATVDISTTDEQGQQVLVYHGDTLSIRAALRVVDRFAPAPVNPYVRHRIQAEHGGKVQIGIVRAEIGVDA